MKLARNRREINLPDYVNYIWGSKGSTIRNGEISLNFDMTEGIDGTDPQTLTQAEIEGRKSVWECIRFIRKYIPGAENAYISKTPFLFFNKEKLDGISVCVPQFLHKEIVIDCLQRGVNVLCEKPLAVSVKEAEEMTMLEKETGVILMTAFCFRFHPPIVKIKEYISEGKLGRILMFRLRFGGYKNKAGQWASEKDKGGGVLIDEAVHAIDLFRYLIGEIKNVSGRTAAFTPVMEAEDSVIILLESDKGTLGTIEDSWATPNSANGIEIYGERGSAQTDFSKVTFKINGNVEQLRFEDDENWLHSKRFRGEISHFVKCIRKEENPKVTGEDGLKAIQIVEAIRNSVKNKRWEEV